MTNAPKKNCFEPDRGASILVVDDQPDNLRTLSLILQQEGFRVRKATDGETALQSILTQCPDLVLLDILMPQMDGYEVCQALKNNSATQEIPIIFISALNDVDDKVKAFEMGGADYITKPFRAKEVVMRINNQLALRQQRQQLLEQNCQLQQKLQERRLMGKLINHICRSLDLNTILQSTVEEIRHLFQVDRVLIVEFQSNWAGTILAESVSSSHYSLPPASLQNLTFQNHWHNEVNQRRVNLIHDLDACLPPGDYVQYLITLGIRAGMAVPIFRGANPWGLLLVHQCSTSRTWQSWEVEFLEQLSDQLTIAIQQAGLFQQVKDVNIYLEQEVQSRTLELQRLVQELQRTNQLKDDFLSTISHELRTPLSNIRIAIRLLMDEIDSSSSLSITAKASQYLQIAQDECEREIILIQKLLDLQQLEANNVPIERCMVNLNEWVPHLLEPFALRMDQQQQTLHVHLSPNLPPLNTDLPKLNRILIELLDNVCKYTPAGETITLSANPLQTGRGWGGDTSRDGDIIVYPPTAIQISLTSGGVEIPAIELPHLFDRFYRVPSSDPWKHSGMGLGLALVKKLVDCLEGTIVVKSGNQQTCFKMTLPL